LGDSNACGATGVDTLNARWPGRGGTSTSRFDTTYSRLPTTASDRGQVRCALMPLRVWPPAAHRVRLKTPNVSDNTEGRSTHRWQGTRPNMQGGSRTCTPGL